jgi:hypothetical protein
MKAASLIAMSCLLSGPAFANTTSERMHQLEHFFEQATIVAGPTVVDCTLSKGTETKCFSITVKPDPGSYTPGPWCPTVITDDATKGGIWLKDGTAHDVDGAFIAKLADLYEDGEWQMFEPETGKVRVTDTQASCEAAARPDVDPEFNNYCVQCLLEYMPEDATMTYVIPLEPSNTWLTNSSRSGSGVAYNGVRLDGPAPVHAIIAAHTIAPFDDCGGHVNTHVGYHYHAVTDCLEGHAPEGDHVQIGIAMDGYEMYGRALEVGTTLDDLDKCYGHETEALGYHYHAGATGSNAILGCLKAETGCSLEDPDAVCDASATGQRP